MSFDIFLQGFRDGDGADADGAVIMRILEPLIEDRGDGWARIRTDDGEADVYGIDHPESGLMVNHASGRQVWDVLFELADAAGLAVMPVGCPTCVADPSLADHLPKEAPRAVVVLAGADILRVVETA